MHSLGDEWQARCAGFQTTRNEGGPRIQVIKETFTAEIGQILGNVPVLLFIIGTSSLCFLSQFFFFIEIFPDTST